MEQKVDTLIAFASNRSQVIIDDTVEALHWSHTLPHQIVVTSDQKDPDSPPEDNGSYVKIGSRVPSFKQLSGFKTNEAIKFAIEQGIEFKVVLVIDDDTLAIGQGFDAWAVDQVETYSVDLLGARDRVSYQQRWEDASSWLEPFMPLEARRIRGAIDLNPETIFYAIHWLSGTMARVLHARNLLVPPGCESWQSWPDVYISWVVHLLGGYQVCWGAMDAPRAPFYANHINAMASAPRPQILHPDFKLYHTIKGVAHFSEQQIRDHYRRVRQGLEV
jgi:hypothetical protein